MWVYSIKIQYPYVSEFSEEWELFDDVSTSINMNNADFGSYDIRWQDTA